MYGKSSVPNFILVGTAKAGTTFLLKYLRQHSDIYLPDTNELYFHSKLSDFDGPYDKVAKRLQTKSFDNYLENFSGQKKEKLIGEFATDYLYAYEESIKSIKKTIGDDVKIVMILRNPVDRTISHYKHVVSKFQEPLKFWDAIDSENDRYKNKWRWVYQYTKVSKYYNQVKAYKENFENVHIIIYDELKNNPKETIDELYKFLDIRKEYFDNIKEKVNVRKVQKSKFLYELRRYVGFLEKKLFKTNIVSKKLYELNEKKVSFSEDDRKRLYTIFKEDIESLGNFLNKDLTHWKYN